MAEVVSPYGWLSISMMSFSLCLSIALGCWIATVVVESRKMVALRMSCGLSTLHESLFQSMNTALGLKCTDFSEYQGVKTWKDDASGWTGSVDWYDESKGSKLTGVSKFAYSNSNNGDAYYGIDAWLGPSFLVPHFRLCLGVKKGENNVLTKDFIPRGAFPLGSDMSYIDNYFSPTIIKSHYDDVMLLPSVSSLPPSSSFAARLLRSPLHLYVSGPGLTIDHISTFSTLHVNTWLEWVKTAQQVDARQRGAINTRDDKLRQFHFQSLLSEYNLRLTAGGGGSIDQKFVQILAAATCGPLAEAYVGGGS